MRPPVVGIFNNSSMAERAIEELREVGFSNQEISYSGRSAKGGFFDNLKSWMTGEEPPSGEEIARGLENMGIPTDAANYYAHEYDAGHPIVAVQSAGHEQEAATVFRNNGGQTYSGATTRTSGTTTAPSSSSYTRTQETGAGTTAGTSAESTQGRTTRGTQGQRRTSEQDQVSMPLREEQLRAEKRPVQTGEVNVRKEVVTEQKSIDVPVSREEVVIERRPYAQAQPSDTTIGEEGTETTRIPVREEKVNVSKETVETGEVTIGKRTTEEQKRFSDTVQREEAEIERSGDVTIHDEDEDENMRRRRR